MPSKTYDRGVWNKPWFSTETDHADRMRHVLESVKACNFQIRADKNVSREIWLRLARPGVYGIGTQLGVEGLKTEPLNLVVHELLFVRFRPKCVPGCWHCVGSVSIYGPSG